MRSILILTDTPARGESLARQWGVIAPCLVIDLLDPDQRQTRPPINSIAAVVSDASLTSSAVIAALRSQLNHLKPARVPYLCLLHEDIDRTRLQATALGAARVLSAGSLSDAICGTLKDMTDRGSAEHSEVEASAAAAGNAFARIFEVCRNAGIVTPELITTGTAFVEKAVQQAGIRAWLEVVWRFDDSTHQHCLLVAGLAAGFGRALGLRRADCQRLTQAAVLHDVGKAKIPSRILNKPGPLTPEERAILNHHPVHGHRMLLDSGFPKEMLTVVRSHHECLDGSGYPDGLSGTQIPDLVRLVSICDIYGALIERRPYKAPLSTERASAILGSMVGKLDGDLVRAFQPFVASPHAQRSEAAA